MLRLGWIVGMITTAEYVCRRRYQQFGCEVANPTESSLRHLDRTLLKDRIAVVVFLLGFIIFAYTFLRAPLFAKLNPGRTSHICGLVIPQKIACISPSAVIYMALNEN